MADNNNELATLTNTVSVSRKIADGNYGSKEITIFAQFAGSIIDDAKRWEDNATNAINGVTALICDHLGITWELQDTGVVVEKAFGGTLVQGPSSAKSSPKPDAKPSGGGTYRASSGGGVSSKPKFPDENDEELGDGPNGPVLLKPGQYGPYVTDGRTARNGKGVHASLPKGRSRVTLTEALELLAEREEYMNSRG